MKKYLGLGLTLSLLVACGNTAQQAELNDVPSAVTGKQDLSVMGLSSVQSVFDKSSKLDSILKLLSERPLQAQALSSSLMSKIVPISRGYVTVDSVASGNPAALLSRLQALGLKNGSAYERMVSGRLPLSALSQAGQLSELSFMRISGATTNAAFPLTGATGVLSQGDFAQRSDVARATYGVDGRGVKIGVISDSFDAWDASAEGSPPLTTVAQDIRNGDLPANGVQVLEDQAQNDGGTDEGRGMAQIVHDVAPGSDIAFATGFSGGEAGFANNIRRLADVGSRVIVDDLSYFAEPAYSDGLITQAVDKVTSQGVAYFTSAGNAASNAYETRWKSGGPLIYRDASGKVLYQGEMLNFASSGVDTMRKMVVPPGGYTNTYVEWDQPFASATQNGRGSRSDLDVFVMDANGNLLPPDSNLLILTAGTSNNIGRDPLETVIVLNLGETPQVLNLVVTRSAGPTPTRVRIQDYGTATALEYNTGAPTAKGHANSRSGAGVGASRFGRTPVFGVNPALPESFTSLGGVPILFDLNGNSVSQRRDQPRFSAPDGANTSFFGQVSFSDGGLVDGDQYPNFFGTSAAAPHAAAAAALIRQARPDLGPAEVIAALSKTAADMNTFGYDFKTGTGLIQVDKAIQSVK
ncbi:peptidase S8 [Deinococcus psychrotolerans]|uniref:Peptidase S8 n=1 Tax=Deinococcus psychrotolerans TaxID=2489213 RepID=A0A3G8YH45_9DEIO|nr:S8 family serine peptidase [Deinococcus psychrotolerans]AZI43527.1 peptidase S8 [Deinococcus psychrotolerans]